MKILIFSKHEFNNFMSYNVIDDNNVESKDMMVISINNWQEYAKGEKPRHQPASIHSHFDRNHSNVLIMHFGDYSEEFVLRVEHEGPTGIFNEHKAKKLYQFIKANKDKSIAVIHCGAGISRSGAIGVFIWEMFGIGNWQDFKRKNPRIQPNGHVYKLLNTEKNKDTSYEGKKG